MPYKVIGNHAVHGVEPGGTLTDAALEDANIEMLIEAGHIDGASKKKDQEK